MRCPKCGTSLPDHAKFCTTCGAPLNPSPAPGSPGPYRMPNSSFQPSSAPFPAGQPAPQYQSGSSSGQSYSSYSSSSQAPNKQPKQKNWTKIISITCVSLLVLSLAIYLGLGFAMPGSVWLPEPLASWAGSNTEEELIETSPANDTYTLLSDQSGHPEPFSDTDSGPRYREGESVLIEETARKENSEELYGRTGDQWLLISDGTSQYLQPESSVTLALPTEYDETTPEVEAELSTESSDYGFRVNDRVELDTSVGAYGYETVEIDDDGDSAVVWYPIEYLTRDEDIFSGPACAQILFDYYGMNASQSELAKGAVVNGIVDYTKLTANMNRLKTKNSLQFTGKYYEPGETSPENLISHFTNYLESGNGPLFVVIRNRDLSGSDKSVYCVLYGVAKNEGEGNREFYLYAPTELNQPFIVGEKLLINSMAAAGFYCYISA